MKYYWIELSDTGTWVLARRAVGEQDTAYWILVEDQREIPDHDDWVSQRIPVTGPHSQTIPRGWEDAPEWALHLAQDSNGAWNWHEHEPEVITDPDGAFWHSTGQVEWAVNDDEQYVGPCYRRPQ